MSTKIVNLILVLRCIYNPRIEKNLFAVLGTRVLMTIFFAPSVYALGFGAHAEYWIPTFKGDLRVDGNGVEGTEINLDNDLNKEVKFNGDTYIAGAYVESDLKTSMIDLEYQYKFLNLENILAGFSIGIIGKIKYLDGEARMNSFVYDNKKDIHVPIPMIGLGAKIGLLADILWKRGQNS